MKGIYLKDTNVAMQFTNKSGSLLLLNTFIQFCKLYNISYTHSSILNGTENDFNKDTKFYIFTRNPIDRFLTSYNWFKNESDSNNNVNLLKRKYSINNVTDFIKHYDTIMYQVEDTHYQPQLFQILEYNTYPFTLTFPIINEKLKNRFNQYQFIKVEDLTDKIATFADTYYYVHGEQKYVDYDYSGLLILDLISEFSELSYEQKIQFNLIYLAMKAILDAKHHKIEERLKIKTKTIIENINSIPIFKLEILLYDYHELKVPSLI